METSKSPKIMTSQLLSRPTMLLNQINSSHVPKYTTLDSQVSMICFQRLSEINSRWLLTMVSPRPELLLRVLRSMPRLLWSVAPEYLQAKCNLQPAAHLKAIGHEIATRPRLRANSHRQPLLQSQSNQGQQWQVHVRSVVDVLLDSVSKQPVHCGGPWGLPVLLAALLQGAARTRYILL